LYKVYIGAERGAHGGGVGWDRHFDTSFV
jgi:hypothetical protein